MPVTRIDQDSLPQKGSGLPSDTRLVACLRHSSSLNFYREAGISRFGQPLGDPLCECCLVCNATMGGDSPCAGINRHVVGVQVPAEKEIANPS